MKKILALLIIITTVVFAQDASRVLTGAAQPPLPFNILLQPGFENRTTGWSVTGGTFTTVSDTANVARGRYSASWLLPASTSAGLIFQSDSITIPAGLYGRDCRGRILFKGAASTNGSLVIEAYDGTTAYGQTSLTDVSTYTALVTSTFTCPTSGSIRFRVRSTATSPASPTIIYFDEVFLGESEAIGTGSLVGVASFGSSPNSSGASISGTNLVLQPASGSQPGGVSTTTQTFAGAKTFASVPTITGLTSGPVINTSGLLSSEAELAIVRGGTGASTADGALTNLLPSQSGNSGKFLKTDGSVTSWDSVGSGTVNGPGTTVPSQMTFWDDTSGTLLGNDVNFTYNKTTDELRINAGKIKLDQLSDVKDYGLYIDGTHQAQTNKLKLISLNLTGDFLGPASPGVNEMYGIKLDVSTNPSNSGALSEIYGQAINYTRSGDDTTSSHYGLRVSTNNIASATPGVGDMFGIKIDSPNFTGSNIGEYFGLHIEAPSTGVSGLSYAIYTYGTARSVFEGFVSAYDSLEVTDGQLGKIALKVRGSATVVGNSMFTVLDPSENPSSNCGSFCVTYNRGTKIKGTQSNDSASIGYVGEVKTGLLAQASAITLTTATAADVTSILLTPGHWMVSGICNFNAAAITGTQSLCAITSTSGNSLTGANRGENRMELSVVPNSDADVSISIPQYEIKLTANTTYYLKAQATFSAGTNKVNGRITAVRIR